MAMLFKDDEKWLNCKECDSRHMTETPVYSYVKTSGHLNELVRHLLRTEIRCSKCNALIEEVSPDCKIT